MLTLSKIDAVKTKHPQTNLQNTTSFHPSAEDVSKNVEMDEVISL
jgi:hypothetical protein